MIVKAKGGHPALCHPRIGSGRHDRCNPLLFAGRSQNNRNLFLFVFSWFSFFLERFSFLSARRLRLLIPSIHHVCTFDFFLSFFLFFLLLLLLLIQNNREGIKLEEEEKSILTLPPPPRIILLFSPSWFCVCVCVYYYTTYYIHFPRWKPPTVRKEKKDTSSTDIACNNSGQGSALLGGLFLSKCCR